MQLASRPPGTITPVLLAAGMGARFGGGKLEAMLNGTMLGLHAARSIAALGITRRIAVCHRDNAALNSAIAALEYEIHINPAPETGLASSLRIGIANAGDTDAVLIALADMPFVTQDHLIALIAAAATGRASASCMPAGTPMPPAILPRAMFGAVAMLGGDQGARALLADAVRVEASPAVLADIDTHDALATAERQLAVSTTTDRLPRQRRTPQ